MKFKTTFPISSYSKRRVKACKLIAKNIEELPLLIIGRSFSNLEIIETPAASNQKQDAWFDYFTGFPEENAAILINPKSKNRDSLFIEKVTAKYEKWNGKRFKINDETKKAFGVHSIHNIKNLKEEIESLGIKKIAMISGGKTEIQNIYVKKWKRRLKGIEVVSARDILLPMRMVKSNEELELIKKATKITANAYKRIIPLIKNAKFENEIAREFIKDYLVNYEPLSFSPIIAAGKNAAALHYIKNNAAINKQDALLIDSGATYKGYCADVTRTIPISGKFQNNEFTHAYQLVLKANALGKKHARPGMTLKELNEIAWKPIIDGGYKKNHNISHHIGLSVHDSSDQKAKLKPGMIISNEPGIYLPNKFGIRIEDMLLITKNGCEELTKSIPKTIKAIEKIAGKK